MRLKRFVIVGFNYISCLRTRKQNICTFIGYESVKSIMYLPRYINFNSQITSAQERTNQHSDEESREGIQ